MATKPQEDAAQKPEEEELIPVETPPKESNDDDDDDDDDEDERLADSEDDADEDPKTIANRRRRKKRRDMQRRAREAQERKMALMEKRLAEAQARVEKLEGRSTQSDMQNLDQQLASAQREVAQAEMIIAKASEAGNGDDVVAAMRIRDEAREKVMRLQYGKQQFEEQVKQPKQPQVDPNVINYAKQWMQANPWYKPDGSDADSAITKQIDTQLAQEGYDPATREYWQELTERVADAFEEAPSTTRKRKAPPSGKRTGPPTGQKREHAPSTTRKEIYVTPERKQAMVEAGVWDDPVQRQRYLKAYQKYDTETAR